MSCGNEVLCRAIDTMAPQTVKDAIACCADYSDLFDYDVIDYNDYYLLTIVVMHDTDITQGQLPLFNLVLSWNFKMLWNFKMSWNFKMLRPWYCIWPMINSGNFTRWRPKSRMYFVHWRHIFLCDVNDLASHFGSATTTQVLVSKVVGSSFRALLNQYPFSDHPTLIFSDV